MTTHTWILLGAALSAVALGCEYTPPTNSGPDGGAWLADASTNDLGANASALRPGTGGNIDDCAFDCQVERDQCHDEADDLGGSDFMHLVCEDTHVSCRELCERDFHPPLLRPVVWGSTIDYGSYVLKP